MYHQMSNGPASQTPAQFPTKDPFYVVKEKVQDVAGQLQQDYHRWKELLESVNTSTNTEFGTLTKNIKTAIRSIRVYLSDLDRTITIVETNRSKFKQISDEELASRKNFIAEMTALTTQSEDTLTSSTTKNKLDKDKRAVLMRDSKSDSGEGPVALTPLDKAIRRSTDSFVDDKRQTQLTLEKEQDIVLDDINEALSRLGDVATTITKELKTQEVLLDEVSGEVDEATDNMQRALKSIDKLLGKSDKGRICCIIILIITVIALFIALLY